jgi:hypothetical protein
MADIIEIKTEKTHRNTDNECENRITGKHNGVGFKK